MTRHGLWTKYSCALLFAVALSALAGCGGDPPSTLPPDPVDEPDAGETPRDAGTPDSGVVRDGGVVHQAYRSLSVVGDPSPDVDFEGKIALQVILLDSAIGGLAGETVNFQILSGDGSLAAPSATTDAVGIARVEFTAGARAGAAYIVALAADVDEEDRAAWSVNVSAPERVLEKSGAQTFSLIDGKQGTLSVKLTQRGRPVAGGKVTFAASGGGGLLLEGQAVDAKIVTTSIQGIATIEIGARNVVEEKTIVVEASSEFANRVSFNVDLLPKPPCTEPGGECPTGQTCDEETEKCVTLQQCGTNRPCNAGYVCSAGVCVLETGSGCSDSSECPSGHYCDLDREVCLSGCEDDDGCNAPQICDENHRCVNPTTQDCEDDDQCAEGYVCAGGRCIPDYSQGGSCSDSEECPMGQYCNPTVNRCVDGCDSDERCDSGFCNLAANACFTPECYDQDCPEGKVCDENYMCVDAPAVILDVSGDWAMVQVFHVGQMLPTNVQNALTKVDEAFGIAGAVLNGTGGNLLPDWVPSAIKDAIGGAVQSAVAEYLPEWATDVVHIGNDVLLAVKDFEIRSTLSLEQNAAAVSGTEQWETAVFYWYTTECAPPRPGQPVPECALMEIDLAGASLRPLPMNITGTVTDATLQINTHTISFAYGKAVRLLLEMGIEALTGYPTIREALRGFIDCTEVNAWVQGFVVTIAENLGGLLELIGKTPEEVAAMVNLTSTCQNGLDQAANMATSYIDQLSANTPIAMDGSATIIREPDNDSAIADHLVRGKWNGTFDGKPPPSGQSLADWYADR